VVSEMRASPVVNPKTLYRQNASGRWVSDFIQQSPQAAASLLHLIQVMGTAAVIISSCTLVSDPWAIDLRKNVRTIEEARKPLSIDDLGWTQERAAQVRARLSSFAEDWDDPEMDIYDE